MSLGDILKISLAHIFLGISSLSLICQRFWQCKAVNNKANPMVGEYFNPVCLYIPALELLGIFFNPLFSLQI